MTEAEQDIALFDFDGVTWRLRGWRQVFAFLQGLEDLWRPMRDAQVNDPINVRHQVNQRIDALMAAANNAKGAGSKVEDFRDTILGTVQENWGPYHPDGVNGRTLLDIRDSVGPEAALFAHAMLRSLTAISTAQTLEHIRGAMLAAFPGTMGSAEIERRLGAERASLRTMTRRLADEVSEAEERRTGQWDTILERAHGGFLTAVRRRSRMWRSSISRWRGDNAAAIESITATERAFKELMRLKAPASYWTDKAKEHKTAEGEAVKRVITFFTLAVPAMALMFAAVGYYLLEHAGTAPPSGLYVIAGAGLATTAGLLFWVGRLLTKLYLSQHHLRQDAEERAVMTTTYLALTADAAAGDDDRKIILGALFRATSDGIVKEEGGLDASLPSLISRLASR